jgi:hypothetical protein
MLENGMKIGAAGNKEAARDRIQLYTAQVLTRPEAKALHYQTSFWNGAIIPNPNVPPTKPTLEEVANLITQVLE